MEDFYKATVNPCSVESTQEPVPLDDGTQVWPVAVSCYQLEDDQTRLGQLDLFLVGTEEPLKFGDPHTIQQDTSGILDGKWLRRQNDEYYWFASARSTGQVRLDAFSFHKTDSGPFSVQHLAISERVQQESALCLSLSWDTTSNDEQQSRIVSSYSNGKVAIHDVTKNGDAVQLLEQESWLAHTLFGNTPVEVWTACFATDTNNGQTVLSGGDDTKLKLWDARDTTRPMQVLQHFEAGVTVLSMDPRRSNVVAVGSYDETIALYDVRKASTPMSKSASLGGGIWRIKWHPYDSNRLLVAAMHGGCFVVNLEGDASNPEFRVTNKFTKHESMAYGADWLVRGQSESHDVSEAASSCSFYDRAVYLWRTA